MLGYMFLVLHLCPFAALPTDTTQVSFTVTLKKFGEDMMVFQFSTPFYKFVHITVKFNWNHYVQS